MKHVDKEEQGTKGTRFATFAESHFSFAQPGAM